MDNKNPYESKKTGIIITSLILAIIIVVASAFVLVFDVFGLFSNGDSKPFIDTTPHLTTEYFPLSAEAAYDFINTTANNLTIIDSRSCSCRYNSGYIGSPPDFEAIHNTNWFDYYNTTIDIIVYDDAGDNEAIEYCENLVNNTYGKLFYLDGGFSAWSKAQYPYKI